MSFAITYLVVASATMIFQVMLSGGDVVALNFSQPSTGALGGLDILGDIVNLAVGFAKTLWNLGTLNLEGAPVMLRTFFAAVNTGCLAYIIASGIRGTRA